MELHQANALCRHIHYQFQDINLLIHALKHRSYLAISNESRLKSNERLELLGDAVLGLVVTDYLYQKFPNQEEGELTAAKSLVVSRDILANMARQFKFGEYILLNDAEDKSGGRNRASILADTMEAIIGAIYLDGGLEAARTHIHRVLLTQLSQILSAEKHRNFKSMLLEYSQSQNLGLPHYVVKNEEGPDHQKLFTVEVQIQHKSKGQGKGRSKKTAEQKAAQMALKAMKLL